MTKLYDIYTRVAEAKEKALAAGYVVPDGTYTLSPKDAAVVVGALSIVNLIFKDQLDKALFLSEIFYGKEDEVIEVLTRVSKEIMDKQTPVYVRETVDQVRAEERVKNQTNKELS